MPTIIKQPIQLVRLKKEKSAERHKLYNSSKWRNLRRIYLMEHPLCEECLQNGVVNADDLTVHHILSPFEPNIGEVEQWRRLLDYSNLKTLCAECHGHLHATEQKNKKTKNQSK